MAEDEHKSAFTADTSTTVSEENVSPDKGDLIHSKESELLNLNDNEISDPDYNHNVSPNTPSVAMNASVSLEKIDIQITSETFNKIVHKNVIDMNDADSNDVNSIEEDLNINNSFKLSPTDSFIETGGGDHGFLDYTESNGNDTDDILSISHSDSDYDEADVEKNDSGQERDQGNGEPVREIDDDEDRKKPQYIPKRGYFYEHDDRTSGDGEINDASGDRAASETRQMKEVRRVPDSTWQHDLYRENEQRSKNSRELINTYGYDIRNEESPPKAARRMKHGPDPNRYTHKWKNKAASSKGSGKPRFTLTPKVFPMERVEYKSEFPIVTPKLKSCARSALASESVTFQNRSRTRSLRRRRSPAVSKSQTLRNGPHISSSRRRRSPPVFESQILQDDSRIKLPVRRRYTPMAGSQTFQNTSRAIPQSHHISSSAKFPIRYTSLQIPDLQNSQTVKNDFEIMKYSGRRQKTPLTRKNANEYPEKARSSRNFSKRIPESRECDVKHADQINQTSTSHLQKTKFERNSDVFREQTNRCGFDHQQRYTNNIKKSLEVTGMRTDSNEKGGKFKIYNNRRRQDSYGDVRDLTRQMSDVNLKLNENISTEGDLERKSTQGLQSQTAEAPSTFCSKRYSYQMQRLLPELNSENNIFMSTDSNSLGLTDTFPMSSTSYSNVSLVTPSHVTIATPLPNATSSLLEDKSTQTTSALSMPFIPFSTSMVTVAGDTLQPSVPPLPIMGYYQHPQGFSNQENVPSQLYTRNQNFMNRISVFPPFLPPPLPVTSSNSHTQAISSSIHSKTVMSYPQVPTTNTQTQMSYNSKNPEAPINQLSELYEPASSIT